MYMYIYIYTENIFLILLPLQVKTPENIFRALDTYRVLQQVFKIWAFPNIPVDIDRWSDWNRDETGISMHESLQTRGKNCPCHRAIWAVVLFCILVSNHDPLDVAAY